MTQECFEIIGGPSKYGLMLSLFDTEMGIRTVKFITTKSVPFLGGRRDFQVEIISAKRVDSSAIIWIMEGRVRLEQHENENPLVSIYYFADIRGGNISLREQPSTERRSQGLMNIIRMMIDRYQNAHSGILDEKIFQLFELAKRINSARDEDLLMQAINEIGEFPS